MFGLGYQELLIILVIGGVGSIYGAMTLALLPGAALAQSSVVERLLALSRESNSECQKQQLPPPALGA